MAELDLEAMFAKMEADRKGDPAEQSNILSNGTEQEVYNLILKYPDLNPKVIERALARFDTPKTTAAEKKVAAESTLALPDIETGLVSMQTSLATINSLLDTGSAASALGKNILMPKFLRPLDQDFQDGLSGIQQLEASAFMQNIGTLKGFGSLSDAEGKKVSAAQSRLYAKDSDGDYIISEETGLELLKQQKASLEIMIKDAGSTRVKLGGAELTPEELKGAVPIQVTQPDIPAITDPAATPPADPIIAPSAEATTTPPVLKEEAPVVPTAPAADTAPISLDGMSGADAKLKFDTYPDGTVFIRGGQTKIKGR